MALAYLLSRPPVPIAKGVIERGNEKSRGGALRRRPFCHSRALPDRNSIQSITDCRAPAAVVTTAADPLAKAVFEAVPAAPLTAPRSLVAVRTIAGMGNGAKDAEPDDTGGHAGGEAPAIPVMVMPMVPAMTVMPVARVGGLGGGGSHAHRKRQPQQRMGQCLEHNSFFSTLRHRATGRAVRLVLPGTLRSTGGIEPQAT